jgi:cytochrome b561
MMRKNTSTAWGSVAKLFHWAGAFLVIYLIVDGWWMTHMVERTGRFGAYGQHALVGYYVLLLIALRIVWRAVNPTPALPAATPPWERLAAHASHATLYILTLGVSFTGWVMVGVGRRPIEAALFGFIPVPLITRNHDPALHDILEDTHRALAYLLLAVVIIHIGAALRHHFYKKNDVLRRMGWASH